MIPGPRATEQIRGFTIRYHVTYLIPHCYRPLVGPASCRSFAKWHPSASTADPARCEITKTVVVPFHR